MTIGTRLRGTLAIAFAVLTVSALLLTSAYGQAPQAQSLGLEDPGKTMNVHILLNLRNESGLRSLVSSIQDKNSPNYHKFLTKEQFATQFAPTAADAKKVANYLTANGLTVTNIDSHNLVVSATGTVAALQTAFSTQIEKAELNGEIFNRPTVEPTVPSSISPLIKTVAGLHTMKAKSTLARQVKNVNNQVVEVPPVKFIKTKPNGVYFPGDCFSKNNDALYLYGTGLEGIYTGNQLPDAGCGYSPAEMQHAYGFDSVIQGGIDGTGQFVTIVDPYGSATILSDANLFSSKYGLPALVPGTNFFQIYNPAGSTPDCVESLTNACGWEVETTLDVEWAHAMAPGAGIILVNPATESLSDLWYADLWIALNLPSGTVSHSYGLPESEVQYYDPTDFTDQYLVNEIVAGFGVSNNYASGDGGDFYGDGMYTSPTDVSFPSGSPDATSVGGTSLALTSTGNYKWETGWGNNIALIGYVPPYTYFRSGAGGGTSQVTAAPTWQSNFLGNTWRQQPDVAMDADPFTGAEVIYTDYWDSSPAVTYVTVVGGTSLSTPMFSAVYALAGQEAGTPYLGNAAANAIVENYLFPGSFKDIVPVGSGHNAHGTIFCNGVPCYNESQWDLAGPYQSSTVFYESIWNANLITVTFGTDSSLTTGPGWDNVTGVGTPNGWYFIGPY